jgi:VWFA-related protein
VRGLARDDFTILDEGKPRDIRVFAFNQKEGGSTAQPQSASRPLRWKPPANAFTNFNGPASDTAVHRTIIVLDGINGWFENFAGARSGVMRLLDKAPVDESIAVYVLANNQGLTVLQDYTTDRPALLKSLENFSAPGMRPAPPIGGALAALAVPTSAQDGRRPPDPTKEQTYEHQALTRNGSQDVREAFQSLAARLSLTAGRKTVYWVTQGFPPSELRGIVKSGWDKTIEALNEANVAVNAVSSDGLAGLPPRWGYGSILSLQEIAERTGGALYARRNDLDQAIVEGIEASRNVYTLGFYLQEWERDTKFHRLTVKVDRPGLALRYRLGYYPDGEERLAASQKKAPVEAALLSPSDSAAVGITAFLNSGKQRGRLRVRVNLDPATLTVDRRGSVWSGNINELIVQLNDTGRQLAKLSNTHEFRFPANAHFSYETKGVLIDQDIQLAGGVTRLAIIVKDAATGRTGLLTIPLKDFNLRR